MAHLLKERIARHLKEIRESRGMTQEEVARAVGVTMRQYQRWEAAVSIPYWRNIEALAKALKVEASEIVDVQAQNGATSTSTDNRIARIVRDLAELEAKLANNHDRVAALERENEELRRRLDALGRS